MRQSFDPPSGVGPVSFGVEYEGASGSGPKVDERPLFCPDDSHTGPRTRLGQ